MATTARTPHSDLHPALAQARQLVRQDHRRGLAAFGQLFETGTAPPPALVGRFAGQFEAFEIGAGLSQLAEFADRTWHPWQGKIFGGWERVGYNRLRHTTFPLVRLLAPTYTEFGADTGATYRAFPFRTYLASSHDDPAQPVLKIDYNLLDNPRWSVRRISDELVQIDDGLFLGKAYVKWWWGTWQRWAFFSLQATETGQG